MTVAAIDDEPDAPAAGAPEQARRGPAPWEWVLLAVIVVVFLAECLALIAKHAPLAHDEAVYSLRARHYAGEHGPTGYWPPYRAVGVPLLAAPLLMLHDGDATVRGLVALIAAGGLAVTWWWARAWFGTRTALLAAAVLAVIPWYLNASYRVFVDPVAATFGSAAVLVFALAIRPDGVRPFALWAVPLAALATLSRYGAPILIAAGMAVVAVASWRSVLRSKLLVGALAASTAAVCGVILFVPAVTGASEAPARAFRDRQTDKHLSVWHSVGDFVDAIPEVFGGPVGWLVVAGLVAGVVAMVMRKVPVARLLTVYAVIVVFFALLNYTLAEGFAQYLVPALPFVAIAAAAGLAPLVDRLPAWLAVAGLALVLAVGGSRAYDLAAEASDGQHRWYDGLRAASADIRAFAGDDCLVVTSYSPQLAWYSRCEAMIYGNPQGKTPAEFVAFIRENARKFRSELPAGARVYWMLTERGKREPTGAYLDALMAETKDVVYRFGQPGDGTLRYIEVGLLGTLGEVTGTPEGR